MFDIGVCSWSIDRHDVTGSLACAGELGLVAAQIGFFTEASVQSADAGAIATAAQDAGVTLVGSFIAFEDEDYRSIDSIARTGGFAPDDLFDNRLALTETVAGLTASLGCPTLAVHIGTVPADPPDSSFAKLVERTAVVADRLATHGLTLLIETGRESADTLVQFMHAVGRENIGVNFDPANFVVYGTDEPVAAVKTLAGHVRLVHMKDAVRSEAPGTTYGRPAGLGGGDACIARLTSKLRTIGYDGPLLIECSGSQAGTETVARAADYLRSLLM